MLLLLSGLRIWCATASRITGFAICSRARNTLYGRSKALLLTVRPNNGGVSFISFALRISAFYASRAQRCAVSAARPAKRIVNKTNVEKRRGSVLIYLLWLHSGDQLLQLSLAHMRY